MMYTRQIGRTETTTEHHDFDATDKYGRTIGAMIFTYEATYGEAPEATWGYDIAPGRYYCFVPHATRNHQSYGASQPEYRFATMDAREQAIAKYLKTAAQRARKAK